MNEPKFKIGDKVRVLDGSKIEGYKGGWAKDTMTPEIGKLHIIAGIEKDKSRIGYNLDFRKTNYGLPYIWDERGLELVEPENAPKFKVGDKVKVIDASGIKGLKRYIRDCSFIGNTCTIRGRENIPGEDHIIYSIEESVSAVFYEEELELIADFPKIIITTDGKTTLARLYEGKKVVKSAEAHCSPDDKFDFSVGANLAMERLTGVDERPRTEETAKAVNEWFSAVIKLTNNLADKWGVK